MYHIFLSLYLSSDQRVDERFLFIRVSFYNTISYLSLSILHDKQIYISIMNNFVII